MRKSTTAKSERSRRYLRMAADIQEPKFQAIGLGRKRDLSKIFTPIRVGRIESSIFWRWRPQNMDIVLLHIDIDQMFLQITPQAKGKKYARPRRSKKDR